MLRRQLLGCLGLLPFMNPSYSAAGSRTADYLYLGDYGSLAELKAAINLLPNKQILAKPQGICEATGEEFKEIYVRHICRPGDEVFAERHVAQQMGWRIGELFTDRIYGTIYWRIPLEWEIVSAPQIVRYCEDGPDIDYVMDKRCLKDHTFRAIKAYCRLTVGKNGAPV